MARDAEARRDPASLNEEVRSIWDGNAAFWDERMGEGNDWHRRLIAPGVERLLALQQGDRLLEVACGNGQLARRLASLGAVVMATDFVPALLERAQSRTSKDRDRIEYRLADATQDAELRSLGESGRFDAVVCNMALMDIADIRPLARALPHLLVAGGRFVFSVLHPCFNRVGARITAERGQAEREIVIRRGVLVSDYATPAARKGMAMAGQPMLQWCFERPLFALLGPFFEAGLVLDALEELSSGGIEVRSDLHWEAIPEIPPILVARLRTSNLRRASAARYR